MNKKIIMLMPYFGCWPAWINLYIESCKYNSDIDWLFYTDCEEPENKAENVKYKHLSFDQYKQFVAHKLNINFSTPSPYKICDLKPTYGFIHENDIQGYDYFGFGDIDLIYGNIRKFYTDKVLKHNIITTDNRRVSGHLTLIRNTELMRNAFRKIKNWELLLESPNHQHMDEAAFSKIFKPHKNSPLWLQKIFLLFSPYQQSIYFKDQYTTPGFKGMHGRPWHDNTFNYPSKWFWDKGILTNNQDADREFIYFHFMYWKKESGWLQHNKSFKPYYFPAHDKFSIDKQGFEFYPLRD
jgi:hypothetical protein